MKKNKKNKIKRGIFLMLLTMFFSGCFLSEEKNNKDTYYIKKGAYTGSLSDCQKEEHFAGDCVAYFTDQSDDISACLEVKNLGLSGSIPLDNQFEMCVTSFSIRKQDNYCGQIPDKRFTTKGKEFSNHSAIQECIAMLAISKNDKKLCDSVDSNNLKEECRRKIIERRPFYYELMHNDLKIFAFVALSSLLLPLISIIQINKGRGRIWLIPYVINCLIPSILTYFIMIRFWDWWDIFKKDEFLWTAFFLSIIPFLLAFFAFLTFGKDSKTDKIIFWLVMRVFFILPILFLWYLYFWE